LHLHCILIKEAGEELMFLQKILTQQSHFTMIYDAHEIFTRF